MFAALQESTYFVVDAPVEAAARIVIQVLDAQVKSNMVLRVPVSA